MPEPRKIFRIEQTGAAQFEQAAENMQSGLPYGEIMRELRALRAALSVAVPLRGDANGERGDGRVTQLATDLNLIAGAIRGNGTAAAATETGKQGGGTCAEAPLSRIDSELLAVVSGTEQATQKILTAAEEIDIAANNLSAALSGKIEQGLAQDIQDLVIQIFEACNFQDLIGQRVAKVLTAMKFVEAHIARVLEEIKTASVAAAALHGPRLDGDRGHASQDDIDAMFAD
jgi:chemotaxis protein CheZ